MVLLDGCEMNILNVLIFHGLSKPICGGQSRYKNLTEQLEKRGNKVFVLESVDFLAKEDSGIAEVKTYKDLRFLGRTLCVFRDFNPSFVREIDRILREKHIDLALISYPSGAPVVKLLALFHGKRIPLVYDAHNVESEFITETFAEDVRYPRLERRILPVYIRFFERFVCKYVADYITSVSPRDKDMFLRRFEVDSRRVFVIPTGARIPELPDATAKQETRRRLGINSDDFVVVFHGIYSHPANKEAFDSIVDFIAPRFRDRSKRVLFVLCGTSVPRFHLDNVVSLGFVEDLDGLLSIADLAIAPIKHGAGVKVKIFDYLSVGLPLIATRKAAEGIGVVDGEHALIVDDVDDKFIDAIEFLANNEKERRRLGVNARNLAVQEYDWERIGAKMDAALRDIVRVSKTALNSGSGNDAVRNR
jgi:glycosyltransferase involved in cell wall biosynthesis